MHHLIFEGAELAGKSWLMSQVYNYIEPKFNQSKSLLDGCYWFNCDLGFYGTKHSKPLIEHYLKMFQELKTKNLIVEKFHLSDAIYSQLYRNVKINYNNIEEELNKLNFKIILITFSPEIQIVKQRIKGRLNLYPHYARILKSPDWYIDQQEKYLSDIKKTKLPYLIIETDQLPDNNLVKKILKWI